MKLRIAAAAGLAVSLASCTSLPSSPSTNPISARWVGQSAGKFFAAYGPPIADAERGDMTVYTWRGGYKTVRVPVAKEDGGKAKGKTAATRKLSLKCQAEITTGADYVIRNIKVMGDVPGVNGPSYCAEFLAPSTASDQ
ncbi:hypothetical protein [Oryzifoliimicrobium ureilyticus]|uniref:hypothetical protein n=1 Tax=Oryzifoliimicrobium ureilyticus TaxID=3113724 RepID=UPI003076609A